MSEAPEWYLTPTEFAELYSKVLRNHLLDHPFFKDGASYHPEDLAANISQVAPIVALTVEALGLRGLSQ